MIIEPLKLTLNDLQPRYFAQAKDAAGAVIDLTGATIVATMKDVVLGTVKINRQSAGITISDAENGLFNYAWQAGDTDTAGIYYVEFEITPVSGGKFTLPQPQENKAEVHIIDSLDTV